MVARFFFGKERKNVQFNGSIPVKELRVGMVGFQELALYGVTAHNLTLEIVVMYGIVWIHQWCGWIGFYGILKHTPVCSIAIDDTRCNISCNGQQTVFCGMHDSCSCTIFLTPGA